MKICVWYIENNSTYYHYLRHLKPRCYMCGWSFDKLLKYISNELELEDIEKDSVEAISFIDEKEHWQCSIERNCNGKIQNI